MSLTRLRLLSAALAAITLSGCWATRTPSPWQYAVEPVALSSGPPKSAGASVKTADAIISHPEIAIQPETSVGYENLPQEFKDLYGSKPVSIGLYDVINQTLANSRDIKIQNYSLQVSEAQIPLSKGIYDLLLQAKYEASRDIAAPTSGLSSIGKERNRQGTISATQLFPTGGRLAFTYAYGRVTQQSLFSILSPLISQSMTLSLTQPLLQGFGPKVTNVDINIAQADQRINAAEFEARVQEQVRDAIALYWDLVAGVQNYKVQVISYTAALDLLRVNTAKEKAGVLAPTEVLQAQARAETRREEVINARALVRNLEDQLKRVMFFQEGSPNWTAELLPMEELSWRELEFDPAAVLTEAVDRRPEVRASLARIDKRDLEIVKTKDLLKPHLDLIGSYRVTGVGDNAGPAGDQLERFDFTRYAVGLEFSHTLQNRRGRYLHRQSLTLREQALEQYSQSIDQVSFEVRRALRDVQTFRERIEVARSRVESEQANLDAERKRYEVGVSTSFQVLEFQEFLANAQQAYVIAVVGYNKATIAVERAKGTILETCGIKVESPDFDPAMQTIIFPVGLN